ncbi:MAG TPA: pyridoxal phosphate-dependent aminotransferase family protein [Flavobacterium sp.]|jgi:8-amino-7-oxononanoate synthase
MDFPTNLESKIHTRKQQDAFRETHPSSGLVDFCSNDYLGFSSSASIFNETHQMLVDRNIIRNGATGSRLISGNHDLYTECESVISVFHQSESALVYNSGYDANLGFFSCVPQRNDVILYDELCHASIRDGIQLSHANAYKFAHNDLDDLEHKIKQNISQGRNIYVATESVFSMDGDSPDLENLVAVAESYHCYAVIDEAHALGVFGENGFGLTQHLNLQHRIFARIMTFGKGLGCHGAAILGSAELRDYLVNFSRSFIYTTGLPPHSTATIITAYKHLEIEKEAIRKLNENILFFNREKNQIGLKQLFVRNKSAIQSAIIPGNEKVKQIALKLRQNGFDIRPMLSPTVPEGQERLRICLHSFNTEKEMIKVLQLLATAF